MKINLSILIALAVLFLSSCGNKVSEKDRMANFIPADAGVVVRIHPDVLMEKADYEALKQMAFFKDGLAEAKKENEVLAAVLDNPANSGVNLEQSSFMAFVFNAQKNPGVGIYLPLADRAKFEEFIRSASDKFEKSEYQDGVFYGNSDSGFFIRDNMAVIVFEKNKNFESLIVEKDHSLAGNSNFRKFLKEQGDVSYWLSSTPIFELLGNSQMVKNLKTFKEEDLKNNFTHAHVSFKNGAVDAQSRLFLSSGLKSDLSLIFGNGLRHDFSKDFPGDNLQGVYAVNISLKGSYQLTKEYFFSGMVKNEIEKDLGLSVEEVTDALTGEMAVAFYTAPEDAIQQKPEIVVGLDIGKKKPFNRLINNLVEKGLLTQEGNIYRTPNSMNFSTGNTLVVQDDVFYVILSKNDALIRYLADGQFDHSGEVLKRIKKISKKHIAAFVLQPRFLQGMHDRDLPKLMEQLIAMEGASGLSDGFFKAEFKDKSTNSLKMFMTLLNESYLADKKKQEERKVEQLEVSEEVEM